MTETMDLLMFAFMANLGLGAALVYAAYSGLEQSPLRGIAYTLTFGVSIITANWIVGESIAFDTWGQFEATALTAVVGAFIGLGAALLIWEPDHRPEIPPIDAEQEQLDKMMAERKPNEMEEDS